MTQSTRRLWGIDVIAAIYGLATLLLVWLCFEGTAAGRTFGIIMAPVCAVLCVGIACRVNIVRVVLMILLAIALVGNVLLFLFYAAALAEIVPSPANKEPLQELIRMPFRFGATLAMFLYLKRSDVRSAFQRRSPGEIDREGPATEMQMENFSRRLGDR